MKKIEERWPMFFLTNQQQKNKDRGEEKGENNKQNCDCRTTKANGTKIAKNKTSNRIENYRIDIYTRK